MRDVAKKAGVSVATVSAVINSQTTKIPISEKTRAKVSEAVKKMNYYVNDQARSLRNGKSNAIGVVVSDITQPFSAEMVRVVEQEVNNRDYHFLLSDIQNNRETEKFYLGLFMQKKVDGILFVGATNELEDEGILMLVEHGIPIVLTEREVEQHNVPCILVDNIKGGYLAVEHLIKQGHKSIGHITGPRGNIITYQRKEGYHRAMNKYGLSCPDEFIVDGGFSLESGYRAMEELLGRANVPRAVFTFNDMLALGAVRAIRDRKLRVPQDVAVVGFDDIPMAAYSEPPLSTVRQPILKMGKEGTNLLLDILDGEYPKDYYKKVVLEPELIVRRSGGCSDT
jgi:DNA-binding LacI/PurR family transcriptional regulator